jgi:hypothetical protein
LRIITPLAVTGCAFLKQPMIKVSEQPPVLMLTMTSAEPVLDRTVRYAHYECDVRRQFEQVDLPLNRADLLEKGINKIMISNGKGASRDITLDVTDYKITAMASGKRVANQVSGVPGAGPISSYWFYPENTIVLSTLGKPVTKEIAAEITDKAKLVGLTPMNEIIAGFETPSKDNLYFVDQGGRFKNEVANAGRPVLFNTVSVAEAGSPYQQPVEVAVFAKLPGVNE